MDLPKKKSHSEPGLNKRDRATGGFSEVYTHQKPGKKFYCRGFSIIMKSTSFRICSTKPAPERELLVLLIQPPKNSSCARQLKSRGTRKNPSIAPNLPVCCAKNPGFALQKALKSFRRGVFRANARNTIHCVQKRIHLPFPPVENETGKVPALTGAHYDPPPRAPANGRPGFPVGFLDAGGRLPCCSLL